VVTGLLASRLAFEQIEPLVDRVFRGLALADLAFPDARAFYSYQFRHLLILAGMLIGSGVIFVFSQYVSRITHHASRFTLTDVAGRCLLWLTCAGQLGLSYGRFPHPPRLQTANGAVAGRAARSLAADQLQSRRRYSL
jgi:hypothetical protein